MQEEVPSQYKRSPRNQHGEELVMTSFDQRKGTMSNAEEQGDNSTDSLIDPGYEDSNGAADNEDCHDDVDKLHLGDWCEAMGKSNKQPKGSANGSNDPSNLADECCLSIFIFNIFGHRLFLYLRVGIPFPF
jgi:hypothetical protein